MKHITFIRHGKSLHDTPLVEDRKRPLSQRGESDSKGVGEVLRTKKLKPDAIYSSPALRAISTCRLVVEALQLPEEFIEVKESLYDFEGSQVQQFIDTLPEGINNILLFGHNNAFTYLVNYLSSTEFHHLPTAGVVQISFESNSWSDLERGKLELFLTPKDL